jgi:hypothetical protein
LFARESCASGLAIFAGTLAAEDLSTPAGWCVRKRNAELFSQKTKTFRWVIF